jgi:hypothetical protein
VGGLQQVDAEHRCEKRLFCAICIDPRQARDKHRETSTERAFLAGNKISILNGEMQELQRIGADTVGERPDEFLASLHSIAVNSKGDLYAAEVSFVNGGGAMQAPAREMQSLHKWERVAA